jgi:Flp pilus assembly protein TadD
MTCEAVAEVLKVQPGKTCLLSGTAFAVSPTFALTAFHVIGDQYTGVVNTDPVVLRFQKHATGHQAFECEVTFQGGDAWLDFALLKLEKALPTDLKPVALSWEIEQDEPVTVLGHSRLISQAIARIQGKVVTPQTSIYGGVPAMQLRFAETDEMLLRAMRGAPVWVGSGAKRAAVGLIRSYPMETDIPTGTLKSIVYACPVETLAARLTHANACWVVRHALKDLVLKHPFPKVREVDCYELLGVSKPIKLEGYQKPGENPPYVPRDVDGELLGAVRDEPFVLVVGPSGAGKSRSAYESIRSIVPSASILVPRLPEHLDELIERLRVSPTSPGEIVLWLDNLEKFLARRALNPNLLTTVHDLGIRVVATMRSAEYKAWKGFDDHIVLDEQRVLERASIVYLDDRMSDEEMERAQVAYPGLELGRRLGESLISGQELKIYYRNGNSALRAALWAAYDWRRTGAAEPILWDDLFQLFKQYLKNLDPAHDSDAKIFHEVLVDACKPVPPSRYSSLLLSRKLATGRQAYAVEDYVSELLEQEGRPLSEGVWELALARMQSEADFLAVQFAAQTNGRKDVTERACATWAKRSTAVGALCLGALLELQGCLEGAESRYREALRLDPDWADAHERLGALLDRQGRLEEAESQYREALRIGPDNASVHQSLGMALEDQKRFEEAETQYREALRLDPENARAHESLGMVLEDQRRLEEAETQYREALRLDPGNAKAHESLGVVLEDQRRLEEAEAQYREALRLDPNWATARQRLSTLLQLQGRVEEAAKEYCQTS